MSGRAATRQDTPPSTVAEDGRHPLEERRNALAGHRPRSVTQASAMAVCLCRGGVTRRRTRRVEPVERIILE